MEISTLGLDPSLSHGVLVKATWDFSGKMVELVDYETLYAWGKTQKVKPGLGKDSSPDDMTKFARGLLDEVLNCNLPPGIPLAVDWDETTVMWRGVAVYAAKVAFLVGYLIRGFQARGTPVVVLTPRQVREHFGLKPRADKAEVWDEVFEVFPDKTNSDTRDSLLLSYILAASERRRATKG